MTDLIRKVDVSFAPELAELWQATFEDTSQDVHSAVNIQSYVSQNFGLAEAQKALSDTRSHCAFFLRNNKPVGFYMLLDRACPVRINKTSSELKQLYVLAEVYESGVGSQLLDHCRKLVREMGQQSLWLTVANNNRRAQKFYVSKGFVALGAGPVLRVGTEQLSSTIMLRDV